MFLNELIGHFQRLACMHGSYTESQYNVAFKSEGYKAQWPRFEFCPHHLLAIYQWKSYGTLDLSSPMCI